MSECLGELLVGGGQETFCLHSHAEPPSYSQPESKGVRSWTHMGLAILATLFLTASVHACAFTHTLTHVRATHPVRGRLKEYNGPSLVRMQVCQEEYSVRYHSYFLHTRLITTILQHRSVTWDVSCEISISQICYIL